MLFQADYIPQVYPSDLHGIRACRSDYLAFPTLTLADPYIVLSG